MDPRYSPISQKFPVPIKWLFETNCEKHQPGYGDEISDVTSKGQFMKYIIDKLGFIKVKNSLCKRQCQENEQTNQSLGENIYRRYVW